jgi:hypothetical protein
LLGGCDFIFRLDPVPDFHDGDARDVGSDCAISQLPFEAKSCASIPFLGTPTEFTELAGNVAGDPTIRGDELELFYVRGTNGAYQMASAVRATRTSPWQLAGDAPFGDSTASETDPAINADGTYVAFVSNRGGTENRIYLAHRACDTWETAPAPGLESTLAMSIDLSWNALVLYYSDLSSDLYQVRRSSTAEPFGPPTRVFTEVQFPAVSSDESELYYPTNGTYRATRPNPDQEFMNASLASDFGGDPDVTVDGTALYMTRSGSSLQVLRRACP